MYRRHLCLLSVRHSARILTNPWDKLQSKIKGRSFEELYQFFLLLGLHERVGGGPKMAWSFVSLNYILSLIPLLLLYTIDRILQMFFQHSVSHQKKTLQAGLGSLLGIVMVPFHWTHHPLFHLGPLLDWITFDYSMPLCFWIIYSHGHRHRLPKNNNNFHGK